MSQLRCRPGDLCVVVKVNSTPEMLGLMVIVDKATTPELAEETGEFPLENSWIVVNATMSEKLPARRSHSNELFFAKQRVFLDSSLHPIRGMTIPEKAVVKEKDLT